MLTKAEKRTLKRVWGRTKATTQLLDLGMNHEAFRTLQEKYKERHILGPYWVRKGNRKGWILYKYTNAGQTGRAYQTTHFVWELKSLLDVEDIAAQVESLENSAILR